MEKKKLYRSSKDKVLSGVCGGIGEFFDIDPTIIRILFILFVFAGGGSILLYLISLIIIPLDPEYKENKNIRDHSYFTKFVGAGLIFLGIILFFNNFGMHFLRYIHFSWAYIFSIFLILTGILLILKPNKIFREFNEGDGKLHKSLSNKMLFGVCGGIGEYLKIDSTFIRLFWIIFTLSTFGISIILYLTLALILPSERYIEKEV
jgi:phage shock protein C